ncbi:hypothetical protein [Nocardia sp. NPDC057227]|uniref:hypothetical protein n=1 Tax=Nocardia sp. NPDC057227 TaxID=3346056 RepID=UPI0036253B81
MSAPVQNLTPLSRTEFTQLKNQGAAGATAALGEDTVAERWRAAHTGWRGRHWAFLADEHGVQRLHPINVTRVNRSQAATAA